MAEERITAWLRIRDRLRFKEGMRSAARSVREFGQDTQMSAMQLELLRQISDRVERQTVVLSAAFASEARAIDDVGDEAMTTAGRLSLLNAANNRTNFGLRRSLTSWKFWKDRLSVTHSEIMSTFLTLSGYLIPAILAMSTSMAGAAAGGVTVLGGAIGALSTGLLGFGLIATKVIGQYGKVKTAQDAYTLAIEQYGAGSKEAARAAGKLYAVISTQGGRPVWNAVRALDALKKSWAARTGPARSGVLAMFTAGITSIQNILPTFAKQTNKNVAATGRGVGSIFAALTGREAERTIVALSRTFRLMSGPGSRATANVIIVLMRLLRATAPWVVKWAESWEKTTGNWRRGTKDADQLGETIDMLVSHLIDWWRLTKAIGGTFLTLFKGANVEGQNMVVVLTQYINKFNEWLGLQVKSGGFQRLLSSYAHSLGQVFQGLGMLFSDPSGFIDKYVPMWADAFARAAGDIVLAFLEAWWHSSLWGKLFIGAMLTKWLFGANLFAIAARLLGSKFVTSFGLYAAPRMAALFAAEGFIGGAVARGGMSVGAAFATAFISGLLMVPLAVAMQKWVNDAAREAGLLPDEDSKLQKAPYDKSIFEKAKDFLGVFGVGGKAMGGVIPVGGTRWVGEHGPELATAGASGTMIRPIRPASGDSMVAPTDRSSLSVSDILPPVHVHVDIDRREIGKANIDWKNDRKSLRGER